MSNYLYGPEFIELLELEEAQRKKDAEDRQAFFVRVRTLSNADFVEAVRDYHERRENWMGSAGANQDLDRELRCRELLKKGTV